MTRQRLEWLALAAIPVLTLLALLHLNAQVSLNLQAESVDRYIGPSAAEIDALNAPILREAQSRGALSPYVDPERIELPIEILRQLALNEAHHYLGLQGEPASQIELYMTWGQLLTEIGSNASPVAVPDRTVPMYVVQYTGRSAKEMSEHTLLFIEVSVDTMTGDVFHTAVGPASVTQEPFDVNIKDRGYIPLDTSLTPQAPLPVPPPTG